MKANSVELRIFSGGLSAGCCYLSSSCPCAYWDTVEVVGSRLGWQECWGPFAPKKDMVTRIQRLGRDGLPPLLKTPAGKVHFAIGV